MVPFNYSDHKVCQSGTTRPGVIRLSDMEDILKEIWSAYRELYIDPDDKKSVSPAANCVKPRKRVILYGPMVTCNPPSHSNNPAQRIISEAFRIRNFHSTDTHLSISKCPLVCAGSFFLFFF